MNSTIKKALIFACILIVVLAGVYLFFTNSNDRVTTSEQTVSAVSVQVPVHLVSQPTTLNIAKRRGLCRTMNTHLVNYSTAETPDEAAQSFNAMLGLASQMLNYYAYNDSEDDNLQHETLASPAIWVNKRDFRDARQQLMETMKQNEHSTNFEAAAENIKTACVNCHQQFLKSATVAPTTN